MINSVRAYVSLGAKVGSGMGGFVLEKVTYYAIKGWSKGLLVGSFVAQVWSDGAWGYIDRDDKQKDVECTRRTAVEDVTEVSSIRSFYPL